MHRQIFINLPVGDMAKSKAFFGALGYSFDPDFTGDQAASLVLGNNLYAMLMVREFFATFTRKPIADAKTSIGGWVCLSCGSREQVDTLVAKAVAAGGTAPREAQDYGFMYSNAFEDLDGHTWVLIHMSGTPPKE
jgi:predicted lactoylglutathione lyase